jgi:hypothetical protein
MKALAAGKHVLLEKPSSNSAEETKAMYEFAESKGLVLLEAFHYRYGEIRNCVVGYLWNSPDFTLPFKEPRPSLIAESWAP